jgi:hypothetical protein
MNLVLNRNLVLRDLVVLLFGPKQDREVILKNIAGFPEAILNFIAMKTIGSSDFVIMPQVRGL